MTAHWILFSLGVSMSLLISGIEYLFLDIRQKKLSWRAILFIGSSLVLLYPGPSLLKALPFLTLFFTTLSFGRPFNGGSDSLLFWLSFAFILEFLFPAKAPLYPLIFCWRPFFVYLFLFRRCEIKK